MIKTFSWMLCLGIMPLSLGAEGIVVDHSTNRSGWGISDTAVSVSDGSVWWGQIADDFQLAAPATIRHVSWWGFYSADVLPIDETMRIRIYVPRSGDGLPGSILFQESLLNPSRMETGVVIPSVPPGTSGTALEYLFEADLPIPIDLEANETYWLEIVQDGDAGTEFNWRRAIADQTGIAFQSPNYIGWQPSTLSSDAAFRLSTIPEPCTLALIILALACEGGHGHRIRQGRAA